MAQVALDMTSRVLPPPEEFLRAMERAGSTAQPKAGGAPSTPISTREEANALMADALQHGDSGQADALIKADAHLNTHIDRLGVTAKKTGAAGGVKVAQANAAARKAIEAGDVDGFRAVIANPPKGFDGKWTPGNKGYSTNYNFFTKDYDKSSGTVTIGNPWDTSKSYKMSIDDLSQQACTSGISLGSIAIRTRRKPEAGLGRSQPTASARTATREKQQLKSRVGDYETDPDAAYRGYGGAIAHQAVRRGRQAHRRQQRRQQVGRLHEGRRR